MMDEDYGCELELGFRHGEKLCCENAIILQLDSYGELLMKNDCMPLLKQYVQSIIELRVRRKNSNSENI